MLPPADAGSDPPDARARHRWTAGVAIVFSLGLGVLFLGRTEDGAAPSKRPPKSRPSGVDDSIAESRPSASLRERLIKAGWSAPAAGAVTGLNREFFDALAAEAPKPSEELFAALERLGRHPKLMTLLADHPELAGLFAGLVDPEPARAALAGPSSDVRTFTAMMLLSPPDQRPALANLFARHGSLIASLHRHGIPGAEALFLDSRAGTEHPGDRAYEDWLAETLDRRLRGDENDLDAFLQVVLEHGPGIRVRLRADPEFRSRFAGELWPALERLAGNPETPIELFLDDPAVWDVLRRKGGEELLSKRGMVAVAVLYGERPWPEAVRDRLVRVLLAGGASSLAGLLEGPFRHEPRFRDLLAAPDLTDETIVGIITALQKNGPDYGPTLEAIVQARNSPERLKALLGPPESNDFDWVQHYIAYSVARKLVLDERVSPEEWWELGIDSVLTVFTIGKIAKIGGKVVTQTLKTAVKEEAGKQLARRSAGTAVRGAAGALATGTTKAAARTVSERLIVRWTVTETIRSARRAAKAATDSVSRRLAVDITKPVRFFYLHTGLGRAHFNRLFELEARIFMRADGRVLFHLDRFALVRACEYLKATAGKPGESPRPETTDTTDLERVRRNAAAMFLLGAAGLLDGPEPSLPGTR